MFRDNITYIITRMRSQCVDTTTTKWNCRNIGRRAIFLHAVRNIIFLRHLVELWKEIKRKTVEQRRRLLRLRRLRSRRRRRRRRRHDAVGGERETQMLLNVLCSFATCRCGLCLCAVFFLFPGKRWSQVRVTEFDGKARTTVREYVDGIYTFLVKSFSF